MQIPRSTAVSWIRRGLVKSVSLVREDGGERPLRERIAKVEGRVAMLTAVLRLVLALLRVSGFSLERSRVPDAAGKSGVTDAGRLDAFLAATGPASQPGHERRRHPRSRLARHRRSRREPGSPRTDELHHAYFLKKLHWSSVALAYVGQENIPADALPPA